MSVALDHLLWAAPDLDAGSAMLAALIGIEPARGGSHPGYGTRNCLVALGGDRYLEVIAPDPAQDLTGNRGGRIAALPGPGLLTFAVRTGDLAGLAADAEAAGLRVRDVAPMGRTRPDGVRLDWTCLYFDDKGYGDLIPFGIDWQGSPHPSGTTPVGVHLDRFVVFHPEPDPLRRIYDRLGIAVAVERADRPGMMATLTTPLGPVVLREA